jgi:hypothetical protein
VGCCCCGGGGELCFVDCLPERACLRKSRWDGFETVASGDEKSAANANLLVSSTVSAANSLVKQGKAVVKEGKKLVGLVGADEQLSGGLALTQPTIDAMWSQRIGGSTRQNRKWQYTSNALT